MAHLQAALAASILVSAAAGATDLATLKEHVQRYSAGAQATLGKEGARCLTPDQALWEKRLGQCTDDACRTKQHLERLAELDPLQPGVTAVKNLELPRVPALAWIIPPAADNVAAPRRADVKPLLVTGSVVDEIATGDGIVLRTGDGARYLLVMLMFLESPTLERLQGFAKAGGTYTARGFAPAPSQQGNRYFEPSRCVFIYREP